MREPQFHTERTIFLVNQISGHGHLDTYARLYGHYLLGLGYRVVVLGQHEPGLRSVLASEPSLAPRYHFVSRDEVYWPADRTFAAPYIEVSDALSSDAAEQAAGAQFLAAEAPGAQRKRLSENWPPAIKAKYHVVRLFLNRCRGRIMVFILTLRRGFQTLKRLAFHPPELVSYLAKLNIRRRRLFERYRFRFRGLRQRVRVALHMVRTEGLKGVAKIAESYRTHRPSVGVPLPQIVWELGETRRRLGYEPSLVLFMYLDMIPKDVEGCLSLERELGCPWSGILFHPEGTDRGSAFLPERYFHCTNARGAIFLNEGPVAAYRKALPRLNFVTLPDVTEDALLKEPSALLREIQTAAGGRKIVLMLGTLSPHKGIFAFRDVVFAADPSRFFFVIAGEIFWDSYGDRQQDLKAFIETPPEHCFVRLGYIDDERELNTLIAAADVLYAVYTSDFRSSSNTLTKAAIFETPVLVADHALMGERVRTYGIGETVPTENPPSILAGLQRLAARDKGSFDFAAYRRDHSIEALDAKLPQMLEAWMTPDNPPGVIGPQSLSIVANPQTNG